MPARVKAFLWHLGASVLIALAVAAVVFMVWYPSPLDDALGVTGIFGVILLVDASLGPLLTLVVYKPGKKSLRFDLAVIFCLQLAALGYGLWTVAAQRPAWIVFNADRFDLVQASAIDTRAAGKAAPEYRGAPWTGPRWVGARPSGDRRIRNEMMIEAAIGGPDIPAHPELYRPLDDVAADIRARALPLDRLQRFNAPPAVAATLREWPAAAAWVPLKARARSMVVLLDEQQRRVAVVDLRPWH
ncbi:MAG: TfpX/TfpZ family type IV pilin accessory protein [Lysobacter sp.]